MRNPLLLLFLMAGGLTSTLMAQKNGPKVYVAKVGGATTSSLPALLTKRDRDEITFQARNTIKTLEGVLNALTDSSLTESERTALIENCYLPNQNKLFLNDGVVVEDDLDPNHRSAANTADLPVDRYLRDLGLFYVKTTSEATIAFSQQVASTVLPGKEYPYIKVFFLSTFKGKRSDANALYQPNQRVAELRPDKVNGRWRTYITRLAFPQPGEGLTELTRPVIASGASDNSPVIKGSEAVFRRTDGIVDTLSIKWDLHNLRVNQSSTTSIPTGLYQRSNTTVADQTSVRITLTDNDQLLAFTRIDGTHMLFRANLPPPSPPKTIMAWLQVLAGTAALAASYTGYRVIRNNYDAYTSQLSALGAEYDIWQSLSRQSGTSPAAPMSFGTYAQPGIYGVYAGGGLGSGLLINGIRQLIKARQPGKRSRPATK